MSDRAMFVLVALLLTPAWVIAGWAIGVLWGFWP